MFSGNWSVAKLSNKRFNSTLLTDVGCTMRCLHRSALAEIEPFFSVNGSFFGPEMLVLSILKKQKMIQIPVNYTKRVGTSSVTGTKAVAVALGLRMIRLILEYRAKSIVFPSHFDRTADL